MLEMRLRIYNAGCGKPKGYVMANSGPIDQIKREGISNTLV